MLPDGWKEKIFGDIVRNTQLGTTKRGADINLDHNLNLVKMGNLLWGSLDLSNVEKLSSNQLDGDYLLKKGDFLFNTRNTPELVGKSAAWKENSGSYCYDNNINRITFSNDADPFYMEYYLNFGSGKKSVRALASGSTSVAAIYWKGLKNLRIILPPLPEQKKIAAILSTWDHAIEGTEKLLSNSQQQKKALMQQLLTGKKRLPGFTGEWESITLRELEKKGFLELGRGNVISKKDIDAHPGQNPIYSSSVKNCGLMGTYGHYMFDEELISWSIDGGGHFFHRKKHKFSITNVSGYMRVNQKNLNYKFLCSQLQFLHEKLHFDYQTKAHPSVIRDLYILNIPPLPEQKAIAAVLTTADEEITALESDLSRLRQEKKALMQQLLTGKRRVKVD